MEITKQDYPQAGKKRMLFKKLTKILKLALLCIALLILIIPAILIFYEDEIKSGVIAAMNKHLNTKVLVDGKNIDITFLQTFPNTTLRFRNISVLGSDPRYTDTLIRMTSLKLHFSLWDVLNKNYKIHEIRADDLYINAIRRSDGSENWNFLKKKDTATVTSKGDNIFQIKKITIHKGYWIFRDEKKKIHLRHIPDEVITSWDQRNNNEFHIRIQWDGKWEKIFVSEKKYPSFSSFNLSSELEKNREVFTLSQTTLKLNDMKFSLQGQFLADTTFHKATISFEGKQIHLTEMMALFFDKLNSFPEIKNPLDVKGHWKMNEKSWEVSSTILSKNTEIQYPSWKSTLRDLNFEARLEAGDKIPGFLKIDSIKGKWNERIFNASLEWNDFSNPYIKINYEGIIPYEVFLTLSGADSIFETTGELKAKILLQCNHKQFDKKDLLSDTRLELTLEPKHWSIRNKITDGKITLDSGVIFSDHEKVKVENMMVNMGTNRFKLDGTWKKWMTFLSSAPELELNGRIEFDTWNLKQWTEEISRWYLRGSSASGSKDTSSGSAVMPYRILASVHAKEMIYNQFNAEDVYMDMDWKDHQIFAEEIRMNCLGGNIQGAVRLDLTPSGFHLMTEGSFNNIFLDKTLKSFEQFGQQTLTDKHVQGMADGQFVLKGSWNYNYECILSSLTAQSEFTLRKGRLKNFEPLKALSRFIDLEDLNDIRFEDISSSLRIEKENIHIARTQIKNSALNITLEGTHGFNQVIDYRISLLLSELLHRKSKKFREEFLPDEQNKRKAFIRIYGPIDQLKFTFDKQGYKEKIKEDFKAQKNELRNLIREEIFGKKDSTAKPKTSQQFELEEHPKQQQKPASKKKNEEEDDY